MKELARDEAEDRRSEKGYLKIIMIEVAWATVKTRKGRISPSHASNIA